METATWNEACQREALALPGHAADELKQQRDVGARDHSAQADAVRKITERFLSRSTAKERLLYDAVSGDLRAKQDRPRMRVGLSAQHWKRTLLPRPRPCSCLTS